MQDSIDCLHIQLINLMINTIYTPQYLSQESLRNEIEKYGDVEVYLCENSADDNGWAFVGFTNREAVERVCRGVKGHQCDSGI